MNPTQNPPVPNDHRFDRRIEDVGNIVEFGHINLLVPDQPQAIIFYVMGLGLTRDPYLVTGVDNAWINVGTCQFHLPVGRAQVLRGTIGIVLSDLDGLTTRLENIRPRLIGTDFSFERRGAQVDVVCPWGNRIRVHAPDRARFGLVMLGMPYVEIDVPMGTAAGIGRFYRDIMGSAAVLDEAANGDALRVPAGFAEALVFRETDQILPDYDGHHIQISVADFSGVHRRLLERGLITEESSQSQYRFQDIVDPDSGLVMTSLEHEVRSMRHPMYARRLVNRDPAITNNIYSTGYETAMWRIPPG